MKKFKTNLFLLGLFASLSMAIVACDSDGEKEKDPKPTTGQTENPDDTNGGNQNQTPATPGDETPIFPEVTTLAGKAGDTLTLQFGANLDWQLTTNGLWCQFNNGLFDLSGTKGEQEVKIAITDANQGFSVDSAEITLKMGQQSQVIAKVYRAALNYEVQVKKYDTENPTDTIYSNETPVVISTTANISLEVTANFVWGVSTTAEWLQVAKSENIITLTVKEGYTQNPINNANDVICINTESATIATIPVSYLGMDAETIIISPSTKWGLNISEDGTQYSESSMTEGEVTTTPAPYKVKLTALNNAYTIVSYKLEEPWGMAMFQPEMGDNPWFIVEDDKTGNISVTFEPNTTNKERQGYLLAIPNAHYEKIKTDLDAALCDQSTDYWDLKPEYEKYTVAHFVQISKQDVQEPGSVSAKYTTGTMEKIHVEMLSNENNPDFYSFVCSEYGVTSVAYITVEPNAPFQVFPTVNDWMGEVSAFVFGQSKDYAADWSFEPGMDSSEKMYVQCKIGNEAIGTYAFIVFKVNGINQQVILVDLSSYEAPEKNIEILNVMDGSSMPCVKADTESEIYMYIASEYGVQSVFTTNLKPEANIFVVPTVDFDNVKVFVNGENKATEWSMEGMELQGKMGILLSVPAEDANNTAHVVFYSNNIPAEALYVTVEGAERATEVEISPANVWNINISQDGSTYKYMFEAPYTATVTALNNDYVLVEYIYDSQFGMTQVQSYSPAWYQVTNDGAGNISVSFPYNNGAERKGYLFAVPGAKYEEIKSDLDGFFTDQSNPDCWELSVAAEQYVVGEFIQEGVAIQAKDLTLTNAISYLPMSVTKLTEANGELYWYLTGEYGAESAYMATGDAPSMIINPGCDFDDIVINEFGQYTNLYGEWCELSMDMSGSMVLNIYPNADCKGKDYIIAFKANYMTKVALYISIPADDEPGDQPSEGDERATEVEILPANAWGIKVSMDGATYKDRMYDFNYEIYDAPYNATVTALNNDYVLVQYIYDSQFGMKQVLTQYNQTAWYNVSDDKNGNISVTFPANSEAERKGYLFALPGAKYEEIKNDLDGFFVEDINADVWEPSVASEQYLVAEFIQEGVAANKGLTIANGMTMAPIEVTTLTEMHGDIYYYLTGEWGAENAYMAMTSCPYMTITPGCEFDDVAIYEVGSSENIASGICEPTMDMEGNMALMFYPSENLIGKELIILFKSNYMTKAGLYFIFGE